MYFLFDFYFMQVPIFDAEFEEVKEFAWLIESLIDLLIDSAEDSANDEDPELDNVDVDEDDDEDDELLKVVALLEAADWAEVRISDWAHPFEWAAMAAWAAASAHDDTSLSE